MRREEGTKTEGKGKLRTNFFMSNSLVRSLGPQFASRIAQHEQALMSVPLLIDQTRPNPRVYPYP